MTDVGPEETLESLIASVTGTVEIVGADQQALRLLLADFLACAHGADVGTGKLDRAKDGREGLVAQLALKGSFLDLDDVHWRTLVHPGSVIWPVVIGMGSQVGADGPTMLSAAYAGYGSTIALAMILGPGHAVRFHATSTCGAFGAAIAAGKLYGLSDDQLVAAGAHAISAAGGLGQAMIERSRSAAFHRIAAATMGCQAARFAEMGYGGSKHVLDGERGAFAVLGEGSGAPVSYRTSRPSEVSVRIYPVNGFAQGPVELAAQLGNRLGHDAEALVAEVPSAVARAVTGQYGGEWWDLKSAVAAAFASGNPFDLRQTPSALELRRRVEIKPAVLEFGQCRLTVRAQESTTEEQFDSPGTDLSDAHTLRLLVAKWDHLLGPKGIQGDSVLAEADGILRRGGDGAREAMGQLLSVEPKCEL